MMKRQVGPALAAMVCGLCLLGIWSWYVQPKILEWRFQTSPYSDAFDIELVKNGAAVTGKFSITKIRYCEFSNAPPAYIRWQGANGEIATGRALIKNPMGVWRELQPRTVMDVGTTRTIGPVMMPIPDQFVKSGEVWAQLVIACDRGDGIIRSFFVLPVIHVTNRDGPVAAP